MDQIIFLVSEGFKNVWRHKATSLTAIFTLYVTLIIVGLFMVGGENIHKTIQYVRSKYKVEVFYEQDVSDFQAKAIAEKIKKIRGVRSATVIGKQDAVNIFQDQFGEDIFSVLGYNPLPASTVVNFDRNSPKRLKFNAIIQEIESMDGVDVVRHQGILVNKLERYYQKVLKNFPLVSGLIVLITVLVIYNTVKLSVYSRKSLIYSMQLIGATKSFIKMPFVFEGLLMGTISTLLVYPSMLGFIKAGNFIIKSIAHLNMSLSVDPFIWLWLAGLAGIISVLGSYRAISSILK
ncbi:MAG: ABC transporter permease [Candidatus Marinimicrobia bacterium]|nr:ABC transporter permease [Candidatus Neomarinimicrobiota bacterium]